MLPLSVWLALSCAELRKVEVLYAERQLAVLEALESGRGEKWMKEEWEKEYLDLRSTLDDIDTAKSTKKCP